MLLECPCRRIHITSQRAKSTHIWAISRKYPICCRLWSTLWYTSPKVLSSPLHPTREEPPWRHSHAMASFKSTMRSSELEVAHTCKLIALVVNPNLEARKWG